MKNISDKDKTIKCNYENVTSRSTERKRRKRSKERKKKGEIKDQVMMRKKK